MSQASERLAALAWQCYDGDYTALKNIITAQGGTWEELGDTTQVAHPAYGVGAVGFPAGDPATTYVQVCFALLGQHWALMPDAAAGQALINRQWKARTDAARGAL